MVNWCPRCGHHECSFVSECVVDGMEIRKLRCQKCGLVFEQGDKDG